MVAIVVWLTITAVRAMAQDNITLSGYIRDGASGEDLIGATIQLVGTSTGAVTNVFARGRCCHRPTCTTKLSSQERA